MLKSVRRFSILFLFSIFIPSHLLAQADPSSHTQGLRFDKNRLLVGVISPDPDGTGPLKYAAVRNTYDGAGRLIKVETGELASWQSETVAPSAWGSTFTVLTTVETAYDLLGRKINERTKGSGGATASLTQYSYDTTGRLQCTAVRMNPAVYGSLPASGCTLGTTGSFGPDRITRNVYDAAGQVVQVRKAVATAIEIADATYSYTPNGKIEFVIDANGNRAKLEYDGHDRQSKWIFPSITRPTAYNPSTQATALATAGTLNAADFEQYGYDANANRTSLRKRDGLTLTYQYDALNRVTRKTVPERAGLDAAHTKDVFYSYDLRGLQTAAQFDSTGGLGVLTAYDGLRRIVSTTTNMVASNPVLTFAYDKNGNRTSITHPGSLTWVMEYDGLDRLTAVKYAGTTLLAPSYNTRGLVAGGDRNSTALDQSFAYDNVGRLSQLGFAVGSNASNVSWTFTRNPASQLLTEVRNNDAYAWNGHVNIDRSYTTNGLNQYTAAGTASFCHDANGNLTADGSSVYKYDVENRLVEKRTQVSGVCPTNTTGYTGALQALLNYDPLGRLYRVQNGASAATRFVHDGDALVMETNDAGTAVLNRYVHGSNLEADDPLIWHAGASVAANTARHLYADPRGSIVLTADSSGTMIARNSYDEYGIPGSANQGRFQYTGQAWLPELGMYYYKARIYSPTLGRFLQTDPIGYDDNVNLYAYVGNDPINWVDDTGEQRRSPRPYQSLGAIQARAQAAAVQRGIQGAVLGYRIRPSLSSRNPSARAYQSQIAEVRADYQALSIIGFGPLNNQSRAGEGIGNPNRAVGQIQQAFEGVTFQRVSSPGTYNFNGGTGGLQAAESFAQSLGGTQIRSTGSGGAVYSLSGLPSGTTGTVSTYQSNGGYARATVTLTTTVTETGSRTPRRVTNEFKVRFDD